MPRSSTSSLPANSSLVAVLLVIKTKAGPSVAFHYPLNPSLDSESGRLDGAWFGNPSSHLHAADDTSESDWSDSSNGERTDADGLTDAGGSRAGSVSGTKSSWKTGSRSRIFHSGSTKDDLDEDLLETTRSRKSEAADTVGNDQELIGGGRSSRNSRQLFGYDLDGLSKLLTPAKAFNKQCFEVGVEDLVFVGAPRFVREDGFWKKRSRKLRAREARHKQLSASPILDRPIDEAIDMSSERPEVHHDEHLGTLTLGTTPSSDAGSDMRSNSSLSGNEMTMFNLVCVLKPPALEYQQRVEHMYNNVAKKLAKALKHEQANRNYVYKETRVITSLKEKAKAQGLSYSLLWPKIIKESTIATAMMVTFDAISNNRIAQVNLGAHIDLAFQIPRAVNTERLPTPFEPQMPGLWLTTPSTFDDDDPDAPLSPHYALLLLEDEEILLREAQNDKRGFSVELSFFIRNFTATKSLLKISQAQSVDIRDLQLVAYDLIYYRRARAIPPLRPRDTYIVSPNADTRLLSAASSRFAAKFPGLPSLPAMLMKLSGKPCPYGSLMPSRDHKAVYMEMLAWLMRGGWVTQLRTFGWIKVSKHVKAVVARANKVEGNVDAHEDQLRGGSVVESLGARSSRSPSSASASSVLWSPQYKSSTVKDDRHSEFSPRTSLSLLSPALTAVDLNSDARSNVSTPQSSRTQFLSPAKKVSPLAGARSHSPLASIDAVPGLNESSTSETDRVSHEPLDTSAFVASIIQSPQSATALESQWIEHIESMIPDDDEVTKKLWPTLIKYLDGRHALETISAREGIKKKVVAAVLSRLSGPEGPVLTVRHW